MNPETNQFDELNSPEHQKKFIDRFYSRESDEGRDIPIFTLGEEVEIKGYVFKVQQISKRRLAFRPVCKA